ncbi:hypothetical protein SAMN06297280_0460 [Arsukibacterium tuosuense]|uniref:Uncharacterized protein n=1 Tax=Arsukibacterium tuosuense TaxID=1323745 RepID=A0A285I3Y9_9GAMM|nr:hypothetical protein [Arsukibacterium tuosuense]SNY42567.1 hypothetical protein SAMN06297280_0460 [Arsukibacterium tuosuense]
MKLPSKTQLIIAAVLVVVGALIIFNFPNYSRSGWYLIIFAIAFFIFPVPQLYSRTKRSQQQRMRERVIEASSKPLACWASPIPWLVVLILIMLAFSF